jgi:hypothetical protein
VETVSVVKSVDLGQGALPFLIIEPKLGEGVSLKLSHVLELHLVLALHSVRERVEKIDAAVGIGT